jgi:hypothetical protein
MNERDEWIAERAAIIWEGSSFPLDDNRWGYGVTITKARKMAENEYEALQKWKAKQEPNT